MEVYGRLSTYWAEKPAAGCMEMKMDFFANCVRPTPRVEYSLRDFGKSLSLIVKD